MPRRHRLHFIAIGLAIALAGSGLGEAQNQPNVQPAIQQPAAAPQQQQRPTPPVSPTPPSESSSPAVYRADCEQPKTRDEADLCEQRRMADAAGNAVKWAKRQFTATIGEIVALVATIGVAIAAVMAAFKANRISRESSERQLRAYIGIINTKITWLNNRQARVDIEIKNCGQTPAHHVTHWVGLDIGSNIEFSDESFSGRRSRNDVAPGAAMTLHANTDPLSDEDFSGIRSGSIPMFAWGVVNYDDVFGETPRWIKYRFQYIASDGVFSPTPEGNESN